MRRLLSWLVLLCWLALVISACEPDRSAHGAKDARIVEDTAGIVRPGQTRVTLGPVKIDSVEVATDDRRLTLEFSGANRRCWSIEQVRVEYAPRVISLAMTGGYHKLPPNTFCSLERIAYSLILALEEAVAGRSIDTTG